MTNPTELLADRLEAGSALYDPQDRKLAVAALRAFASPPSDVGIAKIGRDSANRIMALRHTPPSDVVGHSDMAKLADELADFPVIVSMPTFVLLPAALRGKIVAALRQSTPSPGDAPKSADERAIVFWYKNYKGKQGYRRVVPISIRYGTSDYHTSPQWLMLAFDTEKNAEREFAMSDMSHNVLGTPIVLHPASSSPGMWCRACGTVSSDGTCDCSHFGLNHLRDAVPEPGQQDEREVIARIIEPSAFPANVPDCSCPVCRPWLGVQETALEKADAILSLLSRSPAPDVKVNESEPAHVKDKIRELLDLPAPGNGAAMRGPTEQLQCLRCGTVDAFGPVSTEKK